MGTNDRHEFAVQLAILGTAFGDNGMPKARAEIYYELLKDIPIEVLKGAVQKILKTRKFSSIPTIAEIREAALGSDEELEVAAAKAWTDAKNEIYRGRWDQERQRMVYGGKDPNLDEAVRVAFGGWERFGETSADNEMADRAHFLRVYKGLARQRRERGEKALQAGAAPKMLKEGNHV